MLNVEYLQTLDESDAYDLLAGLRGCDEDGREILGPCKTEITRRLRAIAFTGTYFARDPLDDAAIARVAAAKPQNPHWRLHMLAAIVATGAHPIWAGKAHQLYDALNESPA